jgi:AAA+ superfamily predicted ATPase
LPLADVRLPRQSLDSVVLSDFNLSAVGNVIHEQAKSDLLRAHSVAPQAKLLFCGPPGCGKTLTAEALAYELQRELVIVRVDAVVSSFLGETASNLRRVFDFLSTGQYVAIFDEFDALGRERSDPTEHGELKRVVNAFLQLLDSYNGQSVLIAATNHEGQLDYALWRRFDEVLRFERPVREQLAQTIRLKLHSVPNTVYGLDDEFLARLEGLSFAEIERLVRHAIKHAILDGEGTVSERYLSEALAHELRRIEAIGRSTKQ